jgi:hypothetical protein
VVRRRESDLHDDVRTDGRPRSAKIARTGGEERSMSSARMRSSAAAQGERGEAGGVGEK